MPLDGLQLGHYRLVRLIGSGGMGEVYLAEDTRINRQLAVKIVRTEADPYPDAHATNEATRLFQREMRAITTLDHPHILPLIDFGEQEVNKTTLTFMVMPFRQEGSLADWLRQRGHSEILSPQDVAHFISQAADALQHAHDHQLIHQDIKPSNFLIRSRTVHPNHPDLLLADFGIAKFTTATATASQSIRGTPAYMAPEQWDGQPVAATDQYALAIMAYQLLTGRPPFQGGPGQVMRQHFTTQPQPPSTLNPRISPALNAAILRSLAKQPADRFPSIAAFAQAFQAAVQGQGTQVPSGTLARNTSGSTIARSAPSGADIRATLAISRTEALTGTSRTLTLPGGRRVTIAVPARTQHGQVIHLGGQGEPSSSGGPTGALVLTIAIQQTEEPVSSADSFEKTARASNPNLQRPPVPTSNPSLQRPPMSRSSPRLQSQGVTAFTPASTQDSASRGSSSKGRRVLLIGLALLVIVVGSGLVFYFTRVNSPYIVNPYGGGTLALYDPLHDNTSSYDWSIGSNNTGGSCTFTGGAYHISESNTSHVVTCAATSTNFTNFAFEVQMKIIKGNAGGLVFRHDTTNSKFYLFVAGQDGSYFLNLYVDNIASHIKTLAMGNSSAINQGLGQTNTIAVVAQGSTITLYVNHQQITSVTDSTFSHGQVGVIANPYNASTEVVYSNARVWAL